MYGNMAVHISSHGGVGLPVRYASSHVAFVMLPLSMLLAKIALIVA